MGPKMNYFLKLTSEVAMQTRVTPKFSTLMARFAGMARNPDHPLRLTEIATFNEKYKSYSYLGVEGVTNFLSLSERDGLTVSTLCISWRLFHSI